MPSSKYRITKPLTLLSSTFRHIEIALLLIAVVLVSRRYDCHAALSSLKKPPQRHYHQGHKSNKNKALTPTRRETFLQIFKRVSLVVPAVLTTTTAVHPAHGASSTSDVTITLEKAGDRVGLELYDVVFGSPPKPAVAIKQVLSQQQPELQAGMVLREYSSAQQLQQRLAEGPYPIRLVFWNLAAQGDAISDLGTPIVTAQDALDLAIRTSSSSDSIVTTTTTTPSVSSYEKTVLVPAPSNTCSVQSRRGDVLEIVYEAHLNGPDGPIYDSSARRGTGLPYQMILGSGDMLPGVDQGLYDMCPSEVRGIQIPSILAYGSRENKLFGIPPNTNLYWKVQLVSVNFVRAGDSRTRDELEGRVEY